MLVTRREVGRTYLQSTVNRPLPRPTVACSPSAGYPPIPLRRFHQRPAGRKVAAAALCGRHRDARVLAPPPPPSAVSVHRPTRHRYLGLPRGPGNACHPPPERGHAHEYDANFSDVMRRREAAIFAQGWTRLSDVTKCASAA